MRSGFLLAAAAALALHASPAFADTADLVDPLIGTGNGGNVFPGADTPFGMVRFGPDETSGNQTANVNSGGYNDSSTNKIRGFGLAHVSGAGCGGLAGGLPFYPHVGDHAHGRRAVHVSGRRSWTPSRRSAAPTGIAPPRCSRS